jgi:prepilin-type N-terminal cleavage/methylation domain-containing protein/prepilin-type processing-associated H-X9-DG protein
VSWNERGFDWNSLAWDGRLPEMGRTRKVSKRRMRAMNRRAFTLLELLVVIALMAVILGLTLSGVQRARAAATRLQCQNNLKQIGLACHNYHDNVGRFPPGYSAWPSPDPTATSPGWGWPAYLLPYVEQTPLFRSLRFDLPIENSLNAAGRQTPVSLFVCPADAAVPRTFTIDIGDGRGTIMVAPLSYAGCWGGGEADEIPGPKEGILYRNSRVRLDDVTDGTSQTTLIGDRAWSHAMAPWAGAVPRGLLLPGPLNPWRGTAPAVAPATDLVLAHNRTINNAADNDGSLDDYFGYHPGGVNMLFADGSIHFLRSSIDRAVFRALGTRAGGEVVDIGEY